MASRAARNTAARVANFQEAEVSDVPSVCATCLGPNKYVRMSRLDRGGACKECQRPFTTFSWRVAADARKRSTTICQSCAAAKNACQSCFCDLATGLALDAKAAMTPEEVAEYVSNKTARIEATGDDSCLMGTRLKRRRFEEKVCSFYQKGFCARGEKCKYRHVEPNDDLPAAKAANSESRNGDGGADEGGNAGSRERSENGVDEHVQ